MSAGDQSISSELDEGTPVRIAVIDPEEDGKGKMRAFVLRVRAEDTDESFSQKVVDAIKFVRDHDISEIPASYLYKEYAKDPDYAKMKNNDPFFVYGK